MYERWYHITENHDDLASYFYEVLEAIESADFILQGNKATRKAVKKYIAKKMVGCYLQRNF